MNDAERERIPSDELPMLVTGEDWDVLQDAGFRPLEVLPKHIPGTRKPDTASQERLEELFTQYGADNIKVGSPFTFEGDVLSVGATEELSLPTEEFGVYIRD